MRLELLKDLLVFGVLYNTRILLLKLLDKAGVEPSGTHKLFFEFRVKIELVCSYATNHRIHSLDLCEYLWSELRSRSLSVGKLAFCVDVLDERCVLGVIDDGSIHGIELGNQLGGAVLELAEFLSGLLIKGQAHCESLSVLRLKGFQVEDLSGVELGYKLVRSLGVRLTTRLVILV